MPKGENLTLKQKKFVKEYAKSGNATQAIIDAGYDVKSRKVARSMGAENLAKLGTPMAELLDKVGLTDDAMAEQIKEGALEAERIMIQNGKAFKVKDYYVRHKYIETAAKLKDLFPSAKVDIEGDIKNEMTIKIKQDTALIEAQEDTEQVEGEIVEEIDTIVPEGE